MIKITNLISKKKTQLALDTCTSVFSVEEDL